MPQRLRREWRLVPVWLAVVLVKSWAGHELVISENHGFQLATFLLLFFTIMMAAFAVVRHAEALGERLGEPLGTLILTLAVITIEVSIVAAVMLTGAEQPTLARDTMFAVIMIVLNGLVGFSLLFGGWHHGEQNYNLQGANTFLAVILPLSVIALVLPNYTHATNLPTYSNAQAVIVSGVTIGLYAVFLLVQTTRHRSFFDHPGSTVHARLADPELRTPGPDRSRDIIRHTLLLLAYLVPVVLLAETIAIPIEHGISELHLPAALGGLLVAILILSPEALGAVRAAIANQMQRSINILLGSVAATIGLTVAAVLSISILIGQPVILGLESENIVLLILTLAVSMITFSSGRTNILLGAVHLVLFVTYLLLIFDDI